MRPGCFLAVLSIVGLRLCAQGTCNIDLSHTHGAKGKPSPDICIGSPKLWLYDRMYPMLDGLLRDVEGVSLSSLSGLDANAVNSRVMDLLQNFVQASVSVDQTAGISNAFARDTFNATRSSQLAQLKDSGASAQALANENATVMQAIAAAVDAQTKRVQALPPGTSCSQDAQCSHLQSNVTDLTEELNSLKAASEAVPTVTPAGPQLNPVSGGQLASPNPLSPGAFVTAAMSADPGALSIPAREKLENFITLLNDRLTKQLALNLDEAGMKDTYVPVVVELDVYVNPKKHRQNQTAGSLFRVTVNKTPLDDRQKVDCLNSDQSERPVVVYNLYPTTAAFNVGSVSGKSSGFLLNGGFKGLFLGSTFAWQRQRDHVTEAMMQSVYVNGFRDNESAFGWYYGAPAYTNTVRPGGYATFALLLVPGSHDSDGDMKACPIEIQGGSFWKNHRDEIETVEAMSTRLRPSSPAVVALQNVEDRPYIKQVQYTPHFDTSDTLAKDLNTISLEFEDPINPNLLLTSSGQLLKRVRDWRGRATSPSADDTISITDSSNVTQKISRERGLFEADIDEANTWIAVSRTKVMIKLDAKTAGQYRFPDLRFLVPGSKDWSLTDLLDYRTYGSEIVVGDKTFFACHPKGSAMGSGNDGCKAQPLSMWLPLFLSAPAKGHSLQVVLSKADAPDNSKQEDLYRPAAAYAKKGAKAEFGSVHLVNVADVTTDDGKASARDFMVQRYIYLTADNGRTKLRDTAQVSLNGTGHGRFAHPIAIECSALDPGLLCHLHPATVLFSSWENHKYDPPSDTRKLLESGEDCDGTGAKLEKHKKGNATQKQSCEEPPVHYTEDSSSDVRKSCLIFDRGAAPQLKLRYEPVNEKPDGKDPCDWRNYVFRLQVVQASNNLDNTPTLSLTLPLSADFFRRDDLKPVIGAAESVEIESRTAPAPANASESNGSKPKKKKDAKPEKKEEAPPKMELVYHVSFPVYNASSPKKTYCVVDAKGATIAQADEAGPDDSGHPDIATVGSLTVSVGSSGLLQLLQTPRLLTDCGGSNTLAYLVGVRDLISPANLTLARFGSDQAIYQFTGSNLSAVTGLGLFENGKPIKWPGGQVLAPVEVFHVDDSLVANVSELLPKTKADPTKNPISEHLLFFTVQDQPLTPVVACEEDGDKSGGQPKQDGSGNDTQAASPNIQVNTFNVLNPSMTSGQAPTKTATANKSASASAPSGPTCGPLFLSNAQTTSTQKGGTGSGGNKTGSGQQKPANNLTMNQNNLNSAGGGGTATTQPEPKPITTPEVPKPEKPTPGPGGAPKPSGTKAGKTATGKTATASKGGSTSTHKGKEKSTGA